MLVASLGEALIDFKSTGDLAFRGFPGGSPFNVAVACARLGVPTGFVSQLSTDMFGRRLAAHLESSNVDTGLLSRSSAPTTLAFVEEAAGATGYQFLAEGSADVLFDPQPRPRLPASVLSLHFGSLALLRDPAASAILEIVSGFRGGAVMLDPNVRPTLIADRERYLQGLARWVELSDVIKLSEEDLAWLGRSEDAWTSEWLAGRPRAVIVTAGARGARAYLASGERVQVPAAPVAQLVDTVGAGDSFSGALHACFAELGRLPEGPEEWRGALGFAAAAAALTCGRAGADPPWRHELARTGPHILGRDVS